MVIVRLYIFFLPRYSPHLNRIERLWKQNTASLKPKIISLLTTLNKLSRIY
ncbi:MAG: transposase [Cyclobacteriaceae bacterium]